MATILPTRIKKRLHSIGWKIILAYLLILTVAFLVIGISLFRLVGDYLFTQRILDDQRIVESLSEQMADPLEHLDASAMYTAAKEFSGENARILVTDRFGVVQLDTADRLNGARFENEEVAAVLTGTPSSYGLYDSEGRNSFWNRTALVAFSNVQSMTGVFVSAIVNEQGGCIGTAVYLSRVQEIYEGLRSIQRRILLWLVIVATIVLLSSLLVLQQITRPVGELRDGIAKMAAGDLSARVNVRGKNEFGELAAAFNSMSERIELLDKSRSQFVSNASHELKTPLSTMKILIESLLYQDPMDPGMTKEFLGDINKEIDRLSRIVSDLLTLVNIDSGGMKLKLADLDLNGLLQEQVRRLAPLARENGIELDCAAKETMEVNGDALKLQQVVYNIIDNAIKYTPRGGSVTATISRQGKKALLTIQDTGIGIPAEDLPHIFDRFYRVDKARSRETGGTGLGLSIVRQIVQLHGGDIRAESEPGKGTAFIVELPLAPRKAAQGGDAQ